MAAVGPCTEGPDDSAARAHVVWMVLLAAVAVSSTSHTAKAASGHGPFQPMVTCKLGGGTGVAVSSVQQPS